MTSRSPNLQARFGHMQPLWEDGERIFCRAWRAESGGEPQAIIAVTPATDVPTTAILDRFAHEYSLRDHLDAPWAVRPLDLVREYGRTMLVLEDTGAEPLQRLLGDPLELGRFFLIAEALAAALRGLHERGLIHKDINPSNILVNDSTSQVWLTGFGVASRLPRERQPPAPPEFIAGTLPYMAPEQTGRMNRSIDSRCDLYSLGVTLYQMLTGALPFTARDPMEWVHCHIARTPMPPRQRLATVPAPMSRIVMKLLAKTAEERYQTAAGVEHDLRRCREEWETRGRIDEFPLAKGDVAGRLLIPEKLYGRSREVAALLEAFNRVVAAGEPELVLVSGYSGIGKSSVVNELHKVLVPPRGFFASGKFDQYKRDIPYATVAQAFQSLVRQILSRSEAELQAWRNALREVLGPNGRLIVDLIPELALVIGEQPPVADLSPQDAQRRFRTVLRRFIGIFARPEHPLALFLDDLQWVDAATLDLLEDLLTQSDVRHLLLIGAYRDNEVDAGHPLMRKLDATRQAGAIVQDIALTPLTYDDVGYLISDAVRCETKLADQLVQLVHEKSGGNPFFAVQFLSALVDEGLLIFDHGDAQWFCNLGRVRAKGYTDNVVDLMVAKLERLPAETLAALRQLACIGFRADPALLAMVCQTSLEGLHDRLWEAVRTGLVIRSDLAYTFQHDRIQEAAYSLIPEDARAVAHLRIGRLLLAHTPPDEREEIIFEIVNQFNRSSGLIESQAEREEVAELNLAAGKRARNSAAYSSALAYFAQGRTLLAEDCWTLQSRLAFEIELQLADCEVCIGMLQAAETRLAALAAHVADAVQNCVVARRRVHLYMMLRAHDRALATGLECLRNVGIECPVHPTESEARAEYGRIWSRLEGSAIEDLVDLTPMTDAGHLATLDVLTVTAVAAQYSDENLHALSIGRAVNLCLERGNSDAAPDTYAAMGLIASSRFGRHDEGYRFGKMACDLIDRRGLKQFGGGWAYYSFALLVPRTRPFRQGINLARRTFQMAKEHGDPTLAAFGCRALISILIASGGLLEEVEREVEQALEFVLPLEFFIDRVSAPLALVRTLSGRTTKFGSLDDGHLTEHLLEERMTGHIANGHLECFYWIRKLQARFFAGDYVSALDAAKKAENWYKTSVSLTMFLVEMSEYHLYTALSRAAQCGPTGPDPYAEHRDTLQRHEQQLRGWAENCPENFENQAALVSAEISRLEGRDADAMRLYERAIRSARDNGFIHNEALACETAARFYAGRGFDDIAEMYLVKARDGYQRWGAEGKVRQLEARYPQLASTDPPGGPKAKTYPDQQLDVASVVKASQALSSELVLPKLIEQLMKIAIENAGADRGLLILPSGDEYLISAEAQAAGDEIKVAVRQQPIKGGDCPESLVRYVIRTRESVILDDASKPNLFSADDYLRDRQSKSILCLPLIKQQQLTGILLLENTLTSHAFTADRIAVLELIAAQAAISLEISRLYGELLRAGADLQLQVELLQQLPVSAWTLKPDGTPDFVNRVWLEFAGQTLDFVRSHPEAWMTAVHPEDREVVAKSFWKGVQSGQGFTFEARSLRARDGVYRRHLQQAVVLRDAKGKVLRFVGTTTDIDDQKRAEEALRQAEAELAHANRVATMGELAASIAHEVNQPIAAALMNAGSAVRWLDRQPPNLEEARQAINHIINDSKRAADIVSRIRDLAKKVPARKEDLGINEAVLEIMVLARAALSDHGVSLKMQLSEGLHSVLGDRVQIQQVMLNLIMNAIEAMSEVTEGTRELTISTGNAEADDVLVTVSDTGPGLSQASAERIFEAFYTTKVSGLGMGLSICRSIVEAHGGRLWATPNRPQGAVFSMMLPVDGKLLESLAPPAASSH